MRNRLTSILLVCVIMLGMLPCVSFADETNPYQADAQLLSDLGITSSLTDVNSEISRTDFLKIILNILNVIPFSAEDGPLFSDVSEEDEPYINAAYEYNLINGYSDGKFRGDRSVTLSEAVGMIMNSLGYTTIIKVVNRSPMSLAADADVLDGINTKESAVINKGEAAKLLVNALNAKLAKYDIGSRDDGVYLSDTTMMYQYKKLVKAKGIVTANETTNLYSVNSVRSRYIQIDESLYACDKKEINDYLGQYVEFYYVINDDEKEVLSAVPYENTITDIQGKDIKEVTRLTSEYRIEYLEGAKSKEKVVNISVPVIYNGHLRTVYDENVYKPTTGNVTLIDNNSDGKTDVVLVYDYTTILVSSTNKEKGYVFDKYNASAQYDFSDNKTVLLYDSEGNEVEFSEIAANSVISAAISEDGNLITGYLSKNYVEGTISAVRNTDSNTFITVSDNEYKVLAYYPKHLLLKGGMDGIFYIDAFGNVAGFTSKGQNAGYCYIIKTTLADARDCLIVKYMDINGEILTAETTSDFKLDGVKVQNYDAVPEDLESGCMARYQTNKDGKIIMIDTVAGDTATESETSLYTFGSMERLTYYGTPKVFKEKIFVNADVAIFIIPDDDHINDMNGYRVTDLTELSSTEKYYVQAFSTNRDSRIPEVVLIKNSESITNGRECVLVKEIYTKVNEDNEIVDVIVGYRRDVELELECKDSTVLSGMTINCGDVVKYNLDVNGKVVLADLMYSSSSKSIVTTQSYATGTDFNGALYVQTGKLYDKEQNLMFLSDASDIAATTNANVTCTVTVPGLIYFVDTAETDPELKVKRVSIEEIQSYKSGYEIYDVLALIRYGANNLTVVYK